MTAKEERIIFENNDLHIKLERIHSLAAALESMLEDEPRMRHDFSTLAGIIKAESEI